MWINAWGKKKQLSHYNKSTDYNLASSVSKKISNKSKRTQANNVAGEDQTPCEKHIKN